MTDVRRLRVICTAPLDLSINSEAKIGSKEINEATVNLIKLSNRVDTKKSKSLHF
jgi:hypothetical protein